MISITESSRDPMSLRTYALGFIYFRRGQYQTAARWYENTIELDPSRAVAYLNLGDAVAMLGDKARARKAYETYLALAPNGGDVARVKQTLEGLQQ
jgi:Tfp pilus assembly protein PilF